MTKLKTLLEGFAWERKADGSLPTLQDAINTHKANMSESERWQDDDGDGKWYEPEDVDEAAKPDYIDADGDGDETESMKKAFQDKEKEEMHETFISRMKKNLIGGATRK